MIIISNIITLNQYKIVLIIIISIILFETILLNEITVYNNINKINWLIKVINEFLKL